VIGPTAPRTAVRLLPLEEESRLFLRLRATLAYLNARVEPALSASCYGGRPDATRRGTDRRAALVRFRSLVRDGGLPWVAKLDIASFFDAIPHGPLLAALRQHVASRRLEREVAGYLAWYWRARWPDWPAATPLPGEPVGVPQGSPISGVLVNVFLTVFDRALERAGIVFLRSLDDVTILAASPAALAAGLGTAKSRAQWQATVGVGISGPVAGSTTSSATSSPAGMPVASAV